MGVEWGCGYVYLDGIGEGGEFDISGSAISIPPCILRSPFYSL